MKKKGLWKKKRSKWEEWTHWMNLWYQNAYFYSSHQECKLFFSIFLFFFFFLFFFLFPFFCSLFFFFNQTKETNLAQFNSSIMLVDLIEKLYYKVEKATKYIHTMSPKISLNWGSKRRKMVKSTERIRWVMVKAQTKVANKGLRVKKKENARIEKW